MKILMISLDKHILQKDSFVARRMVQYGKENELFVLIPSKEKSVFDLSQTVHVQSTGGNKIMQFFRLITIGNNIIKKTGIQEITAQDPFFTGLAGWYLKLKTKLKLEVQMHGDFLGGYYGKQWLVKFILRRADGIRVVGERVRQSVLKLGIPEQRIRLEPVQNDPSLIQSIKNSSPQLDVHQLYPGYEKIFLVLGRLDPVKNIPWIIRVFKEAAKDKKYLLLIVGRGIDEGVIQRETGDTIKLQHWTEDPYEYIKSADCVLFPSVSEGYGLVPVEAHILGTPIIMNDVGVANYELQPSDKVTIIPVTDRDAWIHAMLSI